MNKQQEYEKFLTKLSRTIYDIKGDFNDLSAENQHRFTEEVNAILKGYGHVITVEDLMRKRFWRG